MDEANTVQLKNQLVELDIRGHSLDSCVYALRNAESASAASAIVRMLQKRVHDGVQNPGPYLARLIQTEGESLVGSPGVEMSPDRALAGARADSARMLTPGRVARLKLLSSTELAQLWAAVRRRFVTVEGEYLEDALGGANPLSSPEAVYAMCRHLDVMGKSSGPPKLSHEDRAEALEDGRVSTSIRNLIRDVSRKLADSDGPADDARPARASTRGVPRHG